MKKDIITELKKTPEGREYISMTQAALKYAGLGFLSSPGGAMTPAIARLAIRYGLGPVLAMGVGFVGEYIIMAALITVVGTILDPMDYYEGGLMTPEQGTAFRGGVAATKSVLFSSDKGGYVEREANRFLSPPGSQRKGGGLIPLF
jgi:hypothetical protein